MLKASWVIRRGGTHTYKRRFLDALGLTMLESRTFELPVKTKAMGTPHGGVVSVHIIIYSVSITYIGVGLSALLGLTGRAMREPQHRGPSRELAPRFFVCMLNEPKTV